MNLTNFTSRFQGDDGTERMFDIKTVDVKADANGRVVAVIVETPGRDEPYTVSYDFYSGWVRDGLHNLQSVPMDTLKSQLEQDGIL